MSDRALRIPAVAVASCDGYAVTSGNSVRGTSVFQPYITGSTACGPREQLGTNRESDVCPVNALFAMVVRYANTKTHGD